MDLGVQTRARRQSNLITKRQWRRLLRGYRRNGNMEQSAIRADVDRKTARKYIRSGKKPAAQRVKHDWPTRADPLGGIWPAAAKRLEAAPELEAKALLEYLVERSPAAAQESQLRTFQRRVQHWRLTHGPEREVCFPQDSVPGKYLEIDWTHAQELGVTVGGQPLDHLLFHAALKYSNWEWATRCQSESMLSLRHGLQAALWHLGRVPEVVRVDNSSAATHRIKAHREREFNPDFVSLAGHYGLQPQTINLECPNENGDVESAHGHLKRRRQHLLLRGSREFATEAA
jgi:transposase